MIGQQANNTAGAQGSAANPQAPLANQVLNNLLQYRANQAGAAPAAPANERMSPQDARASQSTSSSKQIVASAPPGTPPSPTDRPWDRVRGLLGEQNGYGGGFGGSANRRTYMPPADQSTQKPLPRG